MARSNNTTKNGGAWSVKTKLDVWVKGSVIPNFDADTWRHDKCGAVMKWSEHGNRQSEHGWEIDHINPAANGGGDELSNLQPLNWENNASKGDDLNWYCGK